MREPRLAASSSGAATGLTRTIAAAPIRATGSVTVPPTAAASSASPDTRVAAASGCSSPARHASKWLERPSRAGIAAHSSSPASSHSPMPRSTAARQEHPYPTRNTVSGTGMAAVQGANPMVAPARHEGLAAPSAASHAPPASPVIASRIIKSRAEDPSAIPSYSSAQSQVPESGITGSLSSRTVPTPARGSDARLLPGNHAAVVSPPGAHVATRTSPADPRVLSTAESASQAAGVALTHSVASDSKVATSSAHTFASSAHAAAPTSLAGNPHNLGSTTIGIASARVAGDDSTTDAVASAAAGSGDDSSYQPAPTPGASAGAAARVRKVVKYRCPACSEMVSTVDEALAHCPNSSISVEGATNVKSSIGGKCASDGTGEMPDVGVSKTGADTEVSRADGSTAKTPDTVEKEDLPKGEAIAYDNKGRPSIVRAVDEQTGVARTIVRNEDGSKRIFGQSTVASLANSDMEKSRKWAESLTGHQLRGLVHEVGQRLLEGSREYHARLSDLEKAGERLNLMYFGLDSESTERDADKAYRRMAQKMHPDKNGGTEEAKKRFQHMKERYETLKKKWNPPEDPLEEKAAGDPSQEGKEEERRRDETGQRIEDEKAADDNDDAAEDSKDEEEQKKGKGVSIMYDPKDKESMVKTVTKMVNQLKNIEMQRDILMKELKRAQSQLPADEYPSVD
mmetsp:Transcript_2132/g.5329  ORF Transcript_2132/g.5329 Transcript_2132/m.5329 type:complete len:684 (-) Transcript_2132:218-2269(-)